MTAISDPQRVQAATSAAPRSYYRDFGGTAPENYERYFVPSIGAPFAADLMAAAATREGDRVLDVACGTGTVARVAARQAGAGGRVTGVDLNPGMLAVARAATPPDLSIQWQEANAEAMPLPDGAFDLVLCQLALQFMQDRPAALREMRRVLAPGGRVALSVVGPAPRLFAIMARALDQHVHQGIGAFVDAVFSLNDSNQLRGLLDEAGFRDTTVHAFTKTLRLPPPRDFLWQYIHCTPLAAAVAQADGTARDALERDVAAAWQELVVEGALTLQIRVLIGTGRA